MPKHTLYFSERMYDRLDVDRGGVEGLSGRVSNLCSIALDAMREAIPAMSAAEWQALMDISNGHYRQSDRAVVEQIDSFCYSVSESGMECNDKWGVNCVALARKLSGMTLIEQCAVMEVCRRFWVRSDINSKFNNYLDILAAHGARFSK